jgi:hypothetical protein
MSMMNMFGTAAALTDEALLARVGVLASREREATVELVAHLAELETRQILVAEGYSLFSYCTQVLRLAEHSAYNRIEVARTARRFPIVLDLLAEGALTLSTVRLLAPHLTEMNYREVLARANGKSKREVEVLVARLAPRPDVPATIRKVPVPVPVSRALPVESASAAPSTPGIASEASAIPNVRPTARPAVEPLAPERYRLQVTIGSDAREALRELQDLLPDRDPATIVERALALLLEDVRRRKIAETPSPRPAGPTRPGASSRHIPAWVKRIAWKRDGGQCAYVGRSGHRCTERRYLEFHHRVPHARGGRATPENIALRCRRHNVYESDLVFGPHHGRAQRPDGGTPVTSITPPGPGP